MTMIPESRSRTFNFTWMRPVIQPAKAPTVKEMNNAATGEMVPMKGSPFAMPAAVTAAPSGEGAVYRQIREVQDLISDVNAQSHDGIYKAFFQNTENDRCHDVPPILVFLLKLLCNAVKEFSSISC